MRLFSFVVDNILKKKISRPDLLLVVTLENLSISFSGTKNWPLFIWNQELEWLFPNYAEISVSAQELITNSYFAVNSHTVNVNTLAIDEAQERTRLC